VRGGIPNRTTNIETRTLNFREILNADSITEHITLLDGFQVFIDVFVSIFTKYWQTKLQTNWGEPLACKNHHKVNHNGL